MYNKFFQNVQKQSNIYVQQNLELCYAQNYVAFYQKGHANTLKLPHFITMNSSARKDIKRTDYKKHRRENSNKRNSVQHN